VINWASQSQKTRFAAKLTLLQHGYLLPALDLDAHIEEHVMSQHLNQAAKDGDKEDKEETIPDVDSTEIMHIIGLPLKSLF
jgi:hypothetical protein